MATPRWLADEMVGRLARYLRFTGCDTAYARGRTDEEIVVWAREEDRVVLTRDRALARRAVRSLLLNSPSVREQWLAVARAFPGIPYEVAFTRCTLCNGPLVPWRPTEAQARAAPLPAGVLSAGRPTFRCAACAHVYWDGSHTAGIRRRLTEWSRELSP